MTKPSAAYVFQHEDHQCDQCEMVSINGMACHETGCPNAKKRYEPAGDYWVTQKVCPCCGYETDYDVPCCPSEEEDC